MNCVMTNLSSIVLWVVLGYSSTPTYLRYTHTLCFKMSSNEPKVVIVTGASKGIGAAIGEAFAKEGACLCLTATGSGGPKEFDDVVQKCKDLGAKDVMKICTDLSDKGNMEMVISKTIDKFGKLDILVNNAGIASMGSIETLKLEDFDKSMNINTRTPLYLTQLAVPHLEKTKGSVINMSTIFSTMPSATEFLAYNLSKIALDQLTRIAALDLAKKGIRVNAVRPGAVETSLAGQIAAKYKVDLEVIKASLGEKHPLGGQLIQPEDVANAVTFLASDKARMITGETLSIDCGRILTGQ